MDGKTIKIYKERGETPLERLDRLREEKPEHAHKKLSYAGRLDPMAEGVMLVLVGDANKERERYLKYSKEYTFEILFGFETDTYDLLGLINHFWIPNLSKEITIKELQNVLEKFKGEINQEYPPYSSKTVKGKPLFEWAREGKLDKIKIPKHEVVVHEIKILKERKISKSDLRREIITRIMQVKGDFRQKEIADKWDQALKKTEHEDFQIFKINIFVSSGTYIRVLCNDIGKEFGVSALAFNIKRDDVRTN